jgi:hypothetical protein
MTIPSERAREVMRRLHECVPPELEDKHEGNRARLLRLLMPFGVSGSTLDRWRKGGVPTAIYLPALEAALTEIGY